MHSRGRAPNRGYPRGLTIKHHHLSFGCRLRCQSKIVKTPWRLSLTCCSRQEHILWPNHLQLAVWKSCSAPVPHWCLKICRAAECFESCKNHVGLPVFPCFFAALCVNFLNHHCFSSWWILQNFYVYGSKPFTLITWSLPCQRICPTKVILHFCRTAWMLWMDASPICEAGISTQLQAAHIRSTCRLLCLLPKYIKALPSCTSLNVTGSGRLVFASLHA